MLLETGRELAGMDLVVVRMVAAVAVGNWQPGIQGLKFPLKSPLLV